MRAEQPQHRADDGARQQLGGGRKTKGETRQPPGGIPRVRAAADEAADDAGDAHAGGPVGVDVTCEQLQGGQEGNKLLLGVLVHAEAALDLHAPVVAGARMRCLARTEPKRWPDAMNCAIATIVTSATASIPVSALH